jgi:NhaA family Na+:H+ antiporter
MVFLNTESGLAMAGRLKRILFKPFHQFFQLQTSGGILLLFATVVALLWANSAWQESYVSLWHLPLGFQWGSFEWARPLHFWINDGLMAIFFFVVGLEIKREIWVGELSTPKKAALPLMAALGGMLFPAIIYVLLTGLRNPAYMSGWGIPTVTDIAFALGVLAILGNRVPVGLKVFLTALAIIDDLGAILLIALFYSQGLHLEYALVAFVILALLFGLNRLRIDSPLPYAFLGILLWAAILKSGLHATIAGVLLAFTIPARSRINPCDFYEKGQDCLLRFNQADQDACHNPQSGLMLTNQEHQASVQELELLCEAVQSPLQKLEHILHPWVGYGILPLFALANAGVVLPAEGPLATLVHPIGIGIVLGLFFGKQLGITAFSWLAVKFGLAELPQGVSWPLIYGAGILGGIGFTMSLFISVLAFQSADYITDAKMGVLLASLLSGIVGTIVLWKQLQACPIEEAE